MTCQLAFVHNTSYHIFLTGRRHLTIRGADVEVRTWKCCIKPVPTVPLVFFQSAPNLFPDHIACFSFKKNSVVRKNDLSFLQTTSCGLENDSRHGLLRWFSGAHAGI